MAIEWDDVRVFQSAVRAGDYSTAARKLDMDRTTVGRRFARLERATGRSLWEQTTTGYRPTEAGRAVLRAAAAMERAMARLDRDLAPEGERLTGPVRIAGTAGIAGWLLPAMTRFLDRHPAVSIELVGARDAIAAVNQRHADIGFAVARTKPRDLDGAKVAGFAQARYRRRGSDPQRAIVWGHAMMLANPQPWARLNQAVEGRAEVEVDGLRAMHEAVRAGLGSAWLWSAIGDRDPMLERMAEAAPGAAGADLWVVHRSDLAIEPAVAALRDAAAEIVARAMEGEA
ncbi:DNA-binding transcriptional LysR family regulator [Sphingomonas zeicaulis]|uniref:LysR family transcriptional regulator n=1 Tax=Sphingomonas zeicaulis TaxID=1632740 RepID=UPI003D21DF78